MTAPTLTDVLARVGDLVVALDGARRALDSTRPTHGIELDALAEAERHIHEAHAALYHARDVLEGPEAAQTRREGMAAMLERDWRAREAGV